MEAGRLPVERSEMLPGGSGRLVGVEAWDGSDELGLVDLEWRGEGADASIVSVEPSSAPASGLTVMPGLIDTHVHLVGYAGTASVDFFSWPLTTRAEERTLHGLAQATAALDAGVTTVRDLAADAIQFSLARALDGGIVAGPRVIAFGTVGMTGGHLDLFVPPDFPERGDIADGADACRRLVREHARSGSAGIKIATTGGVLSEGDQTSWRNYTDAELEAIVDEAHALGLPVAAHAHSADGIRRALDAGVDSIEHGTLIDAASSRLAAERGVTVAPTLLINERIAAGFRGASDAAREKATALLSLRDPALVAAEAAGVGFVLGTDANGAHVAFGDQHEELRSMARLFGWSASRTLEAGTSRAADAVGRPRLGRLAPGAAADLVVLDSRPWRDLDELRAERIRAVVSRGRVAAGRLEG